MDISILGYGIKAILLLRQVEESNLKLSVSLSSKGSCWEIYCRIYKDYLKQVRFIFIEKVLAFDK